MGVWEVVISIERSDEGSFPVRNRFLPKVEMTRSPNPFHPWVAPAVQHIVTRSVGQLQALDPQISIDLVMGEEAPESFQRVILKYGVDV
jgi:hypothetical protein